MNNTPTTQMGPISPQILANVILHGDLKSLGPTEKVAYYNKVCETLGLNPLTKPFAYMTFQGKEVLYADKGCAEQLRQIHGISIDITQTQSIEGVYVVAVRASNASGRHDSSTAAINIQGLKGQELANAFMKCETKAKRRVTLSICGLNMLDETEVQDADKPPTVDFPSAPPADRSKDTSNSQNNARVEPPKASADAPKTPAKEKGPRELLAAQINFCRKALKMTPEDLKKKSDEMFEQPDLTALTMVEMQQLYEELKTASDQLR